MILLVFWVVVQLKTVLVHLVWTVRVIYITSWYGVELVVLLDQTYVVGLDGKIDGSVTGKALNSTADDSCTGLVRL